MRSSESSAAGRTGPIVYATASGKGGVGKTLVTANLALSAAQHEPASEVVAADLDFGCGNLNTCLGVRSVRGSVNDFLFERVVSLEDTLTATEVPNLSLISSSYRGAELVDLTPDMKGRLCRSLRALEADRVLTDLGAGASPDILDLFCSADERIVVTSLESVSLHNSFLFIKNALFRYLWNELSGPGFLAPIRVKLWEILELTDAAGMDEILERLKRWDRYSAYIVDGLAREMRLHLIANMYRGGAEEEYIERFLRLVARYLPGENVRYLGWVRFDVGVRESIQKVRPFLLEWPQARAAQDLGVIARELFARPVSKRESDSAAVRTRLDLAV